MNAYSVTKEMERLLVFFPEEPKGFWVTSTDIKTALELDCEVKLIKAILISKGVKRKGSNFYVCDKERYYGKL